VLPHSGMLPTDMSIALSRCSAAPSVCQSPSSGGGLCGRLWLCAIAIPLDRQTCLPVPIWRRYSHGAQRRGLGGAEPRAASLLHASCPYWGVTPMRRRADAHCRKSGPEDFGAAGKTTSGIPAYANRPYCSARARDVRAQMETTRERSASGGWASLSWAGEIMAGRKRLSPRPSVSWGCHTNQEGKRYVLYPTSH